MISVLLVDDHEVVRAGIQRLLELESDLKVVADVATFGDALHALTTYRPDVAVVDLRLGDEDGVTLIDMITKRFPATRTLALTSYGDGDLVRRVLQAGGTGYALKTVRGPSLADAIRRVAAGELSLDPSAIDLLVNAGTDLIRPRVPVEVGDLTPQERRVADLVALGQSNREIAVAMGIADKTVRNYLTRVFVKLDVPSRTALALKLTRLPQ